MAEESPTDLMVFVMGLDDIHVGLTGKDEAPIVIVLSKTHTGLGFPLTVANALHDNLCAAIAAVEDFSDEAKLTSDFSELPKNKLN